MTDQGPPRLFDGVARRMHRRRAAESFATHDFLFEEVGLRLAERLCDVRRRFQVAVELDCRGPAFARQLLATGKLETLYRCATLPTADDHPDVMTEAERLPFAPNSVELVVSLLGLHWANDLPGVLAQIQQALKPDGLFLAAIFGGETLRELREAFLLAEAECEGGAGPRVAPFADLRDLGALLQRASFALPVADSDTITVTYESAFALMQDLRGMGETNTLSDRRRSFTRRATLLRTVEIYQDRFAGPDGRVTATFQICYLTAWKQHHSQPAALKPGSAAARLAEALGTKESPAGGKARPG